MKVGDTVVCVDDSRRARTEPPPFKNGQIYTVSRIYQDMIGSSDWGGGAFYQNRFKVSKTCNKCNHSPEYCNCS